MMKEKAIINKARNKQAMIIILPLHDLISIIQNEYFV